MNDPFSKLPNSSSKHTNKRRNASEPGSEGTDSPFPSFHKKKPKTLTKKSALIHLRSFDVPLVSSSSGSPLGSIFLHPGRAYTLGRANRCCHFRFEDRRISKQHCQILFDSIEGKIYVLDGVVCCNVGGNSCSVVDEFRRRLGFLDDLEEEDRVRVRVSLNGVFVNGCRVGRGMARELMEGDEVLLVCCNPGLCRLGNRVGFVVQDIVIKEEVVDGLEGLPLGEAKKTSSIGHSQGSVSSGKRSKRVYAVCENDVTLPPCCEGLKEKGGGLLARVNLLLSWCRNILQSGDPLSYIRQHDFLVFRMDDANDGCRKLSASVGMSQHNGRKTPLGGEIEAEDGATLIPRQNKHLEKNAKCNSESDSVECNLLGGDLLHKEDIAGVRQQCVVTGSNCKNSSLNLGHDEDVPFPVIGSNTRPFESRCMPPGKKFYLNRLKFMDRGSFSHDNVVSLPELLYPIQSILRIFIATFTSDIEWFLSECRIPNHLPVTIACHNTERCWSSIPEKRTFVPYSDFPNLVVVCPPFPEAIAFGKDRKRQGVACHHPKLIVLQREDSIRVVITSANLVSNQWDNVTNTVWWQDFPRRSTPDVSSLFIHLSDGATNHGSRSDFAAQLAGFMAALLIDVPTQAHWILELTKYNFRDAKGYLVTSVPGIHSWKLHFDLSHQPESNIVWVIGAVETSAVGLSHLFDAAADTNGAKLKRLASFIGKTCENSCGMSEVVLFRSKNVPADANAVSVFVANPDQVSGDLIQLGFLPRHVAKWVSPLWDSGLFCFTGYIYPKEALAAALGKSSMRVQLVLHVSQGPCFHNMMEILQCEHATAFCSLLASLQRCTGLWRLEEVLGQFKWPEGDESDFVYGASSIGSAINAQFLAAFSAAVGKKSFQNFDSEESDPEWGCWSASQERRNPSIRILFPTIERVRNACSGIWPSRRILCFSEKTWQRLKTVDILHDAVPQPRHRVGHPMHVKVARRCFQSRSGATSFGWVYCGSHNLSAAAWGRPVANRSGLESHELLKTVSSLGSRLHICNYELGIIFVFPPTKGPNTNGSTNLDSVVLPFVVPAPKYGPMDRPATKRAMREALVELDKEEEEILVEAGNTEEMMEENPDEEEEIALTIDAPVAEEDKAYAEMLWNQVDSFESG